VSIVVVGAVMLDIKGYPLTQFNPAGRNDGRVKQVHGGVSRNVAEDIGNVELRPLFISTVDDTGTGEDILRKLRKHKVNVDYVTRVPDGMGTWLAIFDNTGDVAASISRRPDLSPVLDTLEVHGDRIFREADSICLEIDMEVPIIKKIFELAQKYDRKVYAVVSNMSIALERRDLIKQADCIVCNEQEAGLFFSGELGEGSPEELAARLADRVSRSRIPGMVVTLGGRGAVYARPEGEYGYCPPARVDVVDTTGAGDAFFAGVVIGLTYGKTLGEACDIGTRMAASVIATKENVCPRFLPEEFDLHPEQFQAENG